MHENKLNWKTWLKNGDQNLKGRILKYEGLQTICAIDKYSRTDPSEEDIDDLREAIKEIGIIAHQKCPLPDEAGE